MSNYDNTNRGSIWENENKRPDKQDADYTGELDVNGVKYWVNAWARKEGASERSPVLSFSIRPKQPKKAVSQQATAKIKRPDPISTGLPSKRSIIPDDMGGDDIPF